MQMEATKEREVSERQIESKEHMWKPAPIMGREFVQKEIEIKPTYS